MLAAVRGGRGEGRDAKAGGRRAKARLVSEAYPESAYNLGPAGMFLTRLHAEIRHVVSAACCAGTLDEYLLLPQLPPGAPVELLLTRAHIKAESHLQRAVAPHGDGKLQTSPTCVLWHATSSIEYPSTAHVAAHIRHVPALEAGQG